MNQDYPYSFIEIFCVFEVFKKQYQSFLTPFFCTSKVRTYKQYIYSLPLSMTKKDKLWCYLNNDLDFITFFNSLN